MYATMSCLASSRVRYWLWIDEFTLKCDEEALHAGIVPAVAGAAHARGDAVRVEQTLVARGGILTAAILVVQEPVRGGAGATAPW